jgi:YHS domain-containing protein
MRSPLPLFILFILSSFSVTAFATDPVNETFFGGVAIHGYDPVAYFTEKKPVKGSRDFSYEWNDAKWFFSSQEHLDLFQKDPEKYAPQFGGYCAWAVAQGSTADIDPDSWTIVDGKLYLNYNEEIQKKWSADQGTLIQKGEEEWPKILEE